jgi:hypothetical protein
LGILIPDLFKGGFIVLPRRKATARELKEMSPMLKGNYEKWKSIPLHQIDRCPLAVAVTVSGNIIPMADRGLPCWPREKIAFVLDPRF